MVGGLAAVVVTVAAAWVLFVPAADWLAVHDVGPVTGALRALRLQSARDAARGRLLTLGAGLFAAGALVYTARNFNLSRRTFEATFTLTEQGQVTERYTKAIEQLGSEKLDVRMGGIYALERIARDSPRDHPTVMEVLAAFIREHSREQRPSPRPGADMPGDVPRSDMQAAMTAIRRRDSGRDRERLSLAGADLTGADLTGAKFTRADLTGAKLAHADLTGADLTGADLTGADLTGAKLPGALTAANLSNAKLPGADLAYAHLAHADLTGADLTRADLTRADLPDAKLPGAILKGAELQEADLTRANLTNADLTNASLTGAHLVGADLNGARIAAGTPVPKGWVRNPGSGHLHRASGEPGPITERDRPAGS